MVVHLNRSLKVKFTNLNKKGTHLEKTQDNTVDPQQLENPSAQTQEKKKKGSCCSS